MLPDDLIDLDHTLLAKLKVVDDTSSGHLVEYCVKCSSLFANERKVEIHLVFTVRRAMVHNQKIPMLVPNLGIAEVIRLFF